MLPGSSTGRWRRVLACLVVGAAAAAAVLAVSPADAQTAGFGDATADTANDGATGAAVSAQGGLLYGDVTDTSVHYPDIKALADDGILDGTDCDAGRFCPEEPLTRWALAVWLVRILDGDDPPNPNAGSRFADVAGSPWWEGHVERLAELEVTFGCGTGPLRFCPDQSVTRAQMASFVARAFELAPAAGAGFEDVTATNAHRGDIDALAASGVTRGCQSSPPLYCPDEPTIRAQMASFLHRARTLPRHLELNVFYCGPAGVYDDARLQDEVDLLQQHVDGFYRRQSGFDASGGTRGTTITFSIGGILPADILPEGQVWQDQTLGEWHNKSERGIWNTDPTIGHKDPCNVAAENRTGNSRSVILLNVASGSGDTLGYAPVGAGPATSLTVERQGEFYGYSKRQFLNHTVAHEIGHAFYGWKHPWKDSDIDVPTSEQLESLMSTPQETADRGLTPRLNLAPGEADSAYVACINLKQQHWVGQETDGNCRRPSARTTESDEPNESNVPDDSQSPATPLELRISWGGDASARTDCPTDAVCRSLLYDYMGDWPRPPYQVECWSRGQGRFGPFLWSGNPSSGCIFWGDDETAQVVIHGIRSNEISWYDATTNPSTTTSQPSALSHAQLSTNYSAVTDCWTHGSEWDGYQLGQCTSYVAWRLRENGVGENDHAYDGNYGFYNQWRATHCAAIDRAGIARWGDAHQWDDCAEEIGIRVDKSPAPGSVLVRNDIASGLGHVAYVEEVNQDGSIVISDSNFDEECGIRTSHTIQKGTDVHQGDYRFIHFEDYAKRLAS